MFELFKEEFDSNTYNCIEEYNADVLRITRELEEELGKVERLLLRADPEITEELGVAIKGE